MGARKHFIDEEWLREQYLERGKSTQGIANKLGLPKQSIIYWLKKYKVPIRNRSGSKVALWEQSRVEVSQRRFYKRLRCCTKAVEFRTQVLGRDGFHCRKCGEQVTGNNWLEVHHIVPFRELASEFVAQHLGLNEGQLFKAAHDYPPFWDVDNAVTLCLQCHRGARRNDHTECPGENQVKIESTPSE